MTSTAEGALDLSYQDAAGVPGYLRGALPRRNPELTLRGSLSSKSVYELQFVELVLRRAGPFRGGHRIRHRDDVRGPCGPYPSPHTTLRGNIDCATRPNPNWKHSAENTRLDLAFLATQFLYEVSQSVFPVRDSHLDDQLT